MANFNSDIYANQIARGAQTFNRPDQLHGRLRAAYFEVGVAAGGAADDTLTMFLLPAGSVRLFLPLSRLYFSAFGAARTLDLGWSAYADVNGATVAADEDGLDAAIDISAAGSVNPGGTVGKGETFRFNSRDGVVLLAKVEGGTIPAAAELDGYWIYAAD